MAARRCVIAVGGIVPAFALLAHGCRTATQITLDVSTNVRCDDLHGVDIVVAARPEDAETRAALVVPGGLRYPTATTTTCVDGKIGTLVITPGDGDGAVVVIAAFGGTRVESCKQGSFGPECIVARRRFSFIDHAQATLPVDLSTDCAGVPCSSTSTCVGRRCVDSKVQCESNLCSPPGVGEADGSSPPPDDGAVPPPPNPPPPPDGGQDAGDAAVDAGSTLACTTAICAGNACTPPQACCYAPGAASCKQTFCPYMAGCCRDSRDCVDQSDVCCASTPTAQPTTTFTCMPYSECVKAGKPICWENSGALPGCGASGLQCKGASYTTQTQPSFFECS